MVFVVRQPRARLALSVNVATRRISWVTALAGVIVLGSLIFGKQIAASPNANQMNSNIEAQLTKSFSRRREHGDASTRDMRSRSRARRRHRSWLLAEYIEVGAPITPSG